MLVEAEVASAVDVCYMGIAYIRPPYDALMHPLKTCGAEGMVAGLDGSGHTPVVVVLLYRISTAIA